MNPQGGLPQWIPEQGSHFFGVHREGFHILSIHLTR